MRGRFSMIVILAATLSCSSCKKEDSVAAGINDYRIRLSAEINEPVSTKAAINSNFTTDVSTGIYAINGNWKAGLTGNNINNDNAFVTRLTGHSVYFANGPYYYPANGSTLTFYAYTPYTSNVSTPPALNTSPIVTIPMTGQEDIMWATGTGNKPVGGNPVNPTLNYNHKLTQLNFIFKSGNGYPDGTDKVTSFLLKTQTTAALMTVGTGNCTFSGTTADMQLVTAAQLSAGGIPITLAGTNAGVLMTNPATSFTIQATVQQQLSGSLITYNTVTFSLNALTGSAHTVTVNFNKTGLSASATLTNWSNGSALTINQ